LPRNSNSRIEDLRQIASTIATTAQNRDVSLDERELVTYFSSRDFSAQLLDLLASMEAEIERLKTELAEGEYEIDCFVAKLYDLSFQDLDIIWDFLLHF